MPTYEYVCEKCGHEFEAVRSISARPLRVCPEEFCARKKWGRGRVTKKISAGTGLLFKGSGFYITDYRSEGYKEAAKKDSAAPNARRETKPGEGRHKTRAGKPESKAAKKFFRALKRCAGFSMKRLTASTLFLSALFFLRCRGPRWFGASHERHAQQFPASSSSSTRTRFRPSYSSVVATNSELVRLDPALLAVSAERVKDHWLSWGLTRRTMAWPDFSRVESGASPDENVTIMSRASLASGSIGRFAGRCFALRLTRALTGAVLLEFANRTIRQPRSAEIPAWLAEGLAQQMLADGSQEMIMSPPGKLVNGMPENQLVANAAGRAGEGAGPC